MTLSTKELREAQRLAYGDCQRAAHEARCAAVAAESAGQYGAAVHHTERADRFAARADAYYLLLTGSDPTEYAPDAAEQVGA